MPNKKHNILMNGNPESECFGDSLCARLVKDACVKLGYENVEFAGGDDGKNNMSIAACMKTDALVIVPGENPVSGVPGAYKLMRKPVYRPCGDITLTVTGDMLPSFDGKRVLDIFSGGRRRLLVHIPDGDDACKEFAEKVIPGVIRFVKEHTEYRVFMSRSTRRSMSDSEKEYMELIKKTLLDEGVEHYFYTYQDPWQMCAFIGEMDVVVTSEFFVGAVAVALGKSVVTLAINGAEVTDFYRSIGRLERCVPMGEANVNVVTRQLNQHHDKPVIITEDMRRKAKDSLEALG